MKPHETPRRNVEKENAGPFPADPVVETYKRDIDRTLLLENLKLTVEQRFRNLQRLQQIAAELQSAGRRASHDRL